MGDYLIFADAIADDIAAGRLRPGDRLLPQREFAYRRKIAPSTAGRVYAELLPAGADGRRGGTRNLRCGADVAKGAGVFIAYPPAVRPRAHLLHLARSGNCDSPERPSHAAARSLWPAYSTQYLPSGTAAGRNIAARFLSRPDWAPSPDQLLFTGNGKQAIAAAIAAVASPGARLGVEAFTFADLKRLAERLGVTARAAGDGRSRHPSGSAQGGPSQAPLSALYLQPVLHNPLGITMPKPRREELAQVARDQDSIIIEDGVNTFLSDDPPLRLSFLSGAL